MDKAIEIIKALVSPTEKLIDVISNGIGILYEPRHKRKMVDATVYEINQIGEAVRNNSDAIISYKEGSLELENPEFNDFLKRTNFRISYQELLKQKNIESVMDKTYEELESKEAVVADPVSVDWISSFFDYVANVSDEQMQILWSKLLQGEISTPGSFSIRTLDLLRKMTHNEANIFKRIVPYVLVGENNNSFTLYLLDELLEKIPGLTFDDVSKMKAAGVISYESAVLTCTFEPGEIDFFENLDKKISIKNNGDKDIKISNSVYILTEFGCDLYRITLENEIFYSQEDYLDLCIRSFLDCDNIYNSITVEETQNLKCEILENDKFS